MRGAINWIVAPLVVVTALKLTENHLRLMLAAVVVGAAASYCLRMPGLPTQSFDEEVVDLER